MFGKTSKSFDVWSDEDKEEEVLLKWSRKGVREISSSQVRDHELEIIKGVTNDGYTY